VQGVAEANLDSPDSAELKKAEKVCQEEYLSCMLLRGSYNTQFQQLKNDLANDMTKGMDNYPKTIVKTMCILNDYKVPARLQRFPQVDGEGMAFTQNGGRSGFQSDGGNQSCWHCGKTRHIRKKRPELQQLEIGVDNLNIENCDNAHALFSTEAGCGKEECTLVQRNAKGVRAILPPDHIYIDTCASYPCTPYPEIMSNIKTKHQGLIGHSNFDSSTMSKAGDLGAISQVWVNRGGIANIVPLKVLEKVWRITYASHWGMNAGHFVIHTDKGNIKVCNNKEGMPYLNLKEVKAEVALLLVQTIRRNMEGFTKQKVEEARAAWEVQARIGHPTDRNFLGMVHVKMIPNCPIIPTAVKNANVIFGTDFAGVMGKDSTQTPRIHGD
jgi:hypothetical protein